MMILILAVVVAVAAVISLSRGGFPVRAPRPRSRWGTERGARNMWP